MEARGGGGVRPERGVGPMGGGPRGDRPVSVWARGSEAQSGEARGGVRPEGGRPEVGRPKGGWAWGGVGPRWVRPKGVSPEEGWARGGGGPRRGGPVPVPGQPLTAPQHVRQLYALVSETLRYSPVLEKLLASAALLQAEKKLPPHLAKVGWVWGWLGGGRARWGRAGLTHIPAGAGVRPALRQGPEVWGPLEGAGPAAPGPAGG